MTILKECTDMVASMADYYSDTPLDKEALMKALKPFVGQLVKDGKGYQAIVEDNNKHLKETE